MKALFFVFGCELFNRPIPPMELSNEALIGDEIAFAPLDAPEELPAGSTLRRDQQIAYGITRHNSRDW